MTTDLISLSETTSTPIKTRKRKEKPAYKYPLVMVTWDDAESDPSWQAEPVEALKPTIVTSVGFLIRDVAGEDRILIADSYIDDQVHTIGNTNKIPRGMIKEFSWLTKNGWKKI